VAAPALPAEVQRLREQLLRDQAPSARARTQVFDPGAFVSRYGRPYSSQKLPINTLREMRTDATIHFAQMTALVSIFSAKWTIESSSARKASFIDHALRKIIGRLIVQYYESWNFGFQALVKQFGLMNPGWEFLDKDAEGGASMKPVWDGGPYPALVWEPFTMLAPQSVAPVWTPGGAFNGIALSQGGSGAYSLPTGPLHPEDIIDVPIDISARFNDEDERQRKVDVDHSLWVTNERDGSFGSIWGQSRMAYAYKYWWSYELVLGILNRSVEKKGDPTIVVSFPTGSSSVNGQEVPNRDIAFQIGESARSGSVLAVPSEVWGDDMATSNQAPKWKIDTLSLEQNFDQLIKVLDYFGTMKFRSMNVSELALTEGAGGSSSRNVAATTGERTAEAQIFTQMEWDETINRYMIPQLADANFPELADAPARKVTQAFGENEANLAADILRSFANSNAEGLPIDKPSLLERFQIPSLEGPELEDWMKRQIQQAENSQPPATPAQPNGAAGVTDTGFYYEAPDLIQLEDEALLASLPKTKVYADRAVLAQTRLVRKLSKETLSAAYEDFASYFSDVADLSLAADEDSTSIANRIVSAWQFSYGKMVKVVALALSKILARAGRLELSLSRLQIDAWNPEDETILDWSRKNTAALVRSVDQTTRDQLRSFLANELSEGRTADEIAANLREHFSEFPDWRADLIARQETSRFYTAGTLFAAQSAGASQVQALDAQLGPSDSTCEQRNGQVFDLEGAWRASDEEHIRGTLCWRIIPGTALSFAHAKSTEMNGRLAQVDPENRKILLTEGLDPESEGKFLLQAVDWLISAS
jgi:hypothetical protein